MNENTVQNTTKKPIWKKVMLLLLPILALGALLAIEPVRNAIGEAIAILSRLDLEPVKEYLRSFGALGPVVSFLLMVLQSVMAPLPAFLLTFANAAIWGWGWGSLLSWSSAMAGAALCFGIARFYGRDVVARFTSKTALSSVDSFFAKHGDHAVLVARLLPFISFDIVSYAAGLTPMRWWAFLVATGLGQLPATIIYSVVGDKLTGGSQVFVTGLLVLFAALALTFMIKAIFKERKAKEQA